MSPRRSDSPTPAEARARAALRALERPRPDAAFRERLKHDFVTGRVGERRVLELPLAWHRRRAWRLALAPVAVAALVVAGALANRGPGWTLLATRGDGTVIVDGRPVPLAHAEELAARLRPGARLVVPAATEIELASAGRMAIEVLAGSEITLPASPGRWLGRNVVGEVRRGEIRLTTGPAFRGAHLRLDTPEATVHVTGTTLAVIREEVGTCVCVYDGSVRVGPRGAAAETVPSGRRRFVFNDGRPPELADIRPVELEQLGKFHDQHGAWLVGSSR